MGEDPANSSKPVSPQAVWSAYKVPVILASVSVFLVGLAIVLLVKSVQTTTPIQFTSQEADALGASTSASAGILVDVAGAVDKPGIYRLNFGARVEDALVAAGGLAGDADMAWLARNLNRAMRLNDGVKVYIPIVGELEESRTVDFTAAAGGVSQSTGAVSVNMASQSELESLPDVGPVTAVKIIDNRPYGSLEDLVAKKAMGQSLYDKLKSQLTL